MAYPLNVNDIVEVTFAGTQIGQMMMSVLHFEVTAPITTPDAGAVFDSLANNLIDGFGLNVTYLQCCANDLVNAYITIQKVASDRFIKRRYDAAFSEGQVVSRSVSCNTAIAITKKGDAANRHNLGTLHMPGVPQIWVTDSALNAAGITGYAPLVTALKNQIVVGGVTLKPVIFNKAAPLTSQFVTSSALQQTLRTMRRRTVGVGK